jgi:uncharacterized membrane protein
VFRARRGPERLLLAVGVVVGLLFALLYPPFSAGADEATHLGRALEMAHGRLTPGEVDGAIGSPIPRTYREDQDEVILLLFRGGPFDDDTYSVLARSRPDWSDTFVVDTQPTMAATPFAYAPSALAMVIPDRLGWAGIFVLWAGRIGNLVVYLALAWVAVRVATAFRWTLAIAALFPMNLGIAASVTPDALTIAAFLLVIAVWTRVWRPDGVAGPEGDGGEDGATSMAADGHPHDPDAVRSQDEVLAALGLDAPTSTPAATTAAPSAATAAPIAAPNATATAAVDAEPVPAAPGPLARLDAWTRTPIGTGVMVLVAGLLLVATKPPYFLILVAFPALLLTAWRDARLRLAAVAGVVGLAAGGLFTLLSSSGSYKAVTENLNGGIAYQPDVQQERLLSDPLGFLGRVAGDWFGNLDLTVQRWVRHVGYVEVTLPAWVSWLFVIAVIVAALLLDRRDLLGLRRWARAIWALLAAGMIVALYTSSYLYFDDTVEGTYMGLQIPRYVSPFFAIAVMGWVPRFPVALPPSRPLLARVPTWVPVAIVVVVQAVMIVAAVRTWTVTGWSLETG